MATLDKITFGVKEANQFMPRAELVVELNVTRRFIWMLKLKLIWDIIRLKPTFTDHA